MNKITGLAMVIFGVTILFDRFVKTIPSKIAVAIYGVALVLLIAGMISARNNG